MPSHPFTADARCNHIAPAACGQRLYRMIIGLVAMLICTIPIDAQVTVTEEQLIGGWRDETAVVVYYENLDIYVKWDNGVESFGKWSLSSNTLSLTLPCSISSGRISTEDVDPIQSTITAVSPTAFRYTDGSRTYSSRRLPSNRIPVVRERLREECKSYYEAKARQEQINREQLRQQLADEERDGLLVFAMQFERIAMVWEKPETRSAMLGCVRLETTAWQAEIERMRRETSSLRSRSKIDSAEATHREYLTATPLIARARCHARWTTMLAYQVTRNNTEHLLQRAQLPQDGNHENFKALLDDFTPNVWGFTRIALRATTTEAFLTAGPWALTESEIDALSRCRSNCSELEGRYAARGAQMVLDVLTTGPWRNGWRDSYLQINPIISQAMELTSAPKANFSDEGMAQRFSVDSVNFSPSPELKARVRLSVNRVLAALGCRWPEQGFGEAWSYTAACPVPPAAAR